MNATSLLVSTSRLVFQYEAGDQQILSDLYRLVPYLRQSLSCTVCGSLLIEPYTPQETQCQHHVCRHCIGGRKNLKPTCTWCRDYQKYEVNSQLRILLQCYKSLCEYIMSKPIYSFVNNTQQFTGGTVMNGGGGGNSTSTSSSSSSSSSAAVSSSLVELIEEGARFQDNYKSNSGLLKSTYSMLPCVYTQPLSNTNLTQQTHQSTTTLLQNSSITTTHSTNHFDSGGRDSLQKSHHQQQYSGIAQPAQSNLSPLTTSAPIKTVSNGSAMYSVLYAGSGNKITIKRKTENNVIDQTPATVDDLALANNTASIKDQLNAVTAAAGQQHQQNFKKPTASRSKTLQKRKGCRCGNATPTPGKLTCCGQRCPCYVEAKSCLDCKCRGCRNPHRADGFKIRPHIPELDCIELLDTSNDLSAPSTVHSLDLDPFGTNNSSSSSSMGSSALGTTVISSRLQSLDTPSDISLDQDSIMFSTNDLVDGSNIQVVNVYTTHLPTVSYTLPTILMQENSPTFITSMPQSTLLASTSMTSSSPPLLAASSPSSQPYIINHSSMHSIFGDDLLATTQPCAVNALSVDDEDDDDDDAGECDIDDDDDDDEDDEDTSDDHSDVDIDI